MDENSSEWEMCKENIRPLKQGRKIDSLKSALCPIDDYKQLKRQAFETALRNHTGDDLLEIWHEYILWIEQNYPTSGKESGIFRLLESCVIAFKDKQQYYNNEKYIEIWIKYANAHPDAIEIFRYMYSHKIGCQHAVFYENWAWSLENMGNFKYADEVLTEGIQQNAQPVDNLIMRQRKLQQILVKEIKKNLETFSDENAFQESRTALGFLKFDKRNTVPLNRSEATKLDLSVNVQKSENLDKKKNNKKAFNVYKDENTYSSSIPSQTKNSIKIASRAEKAKENEMKPKKWSEAKISQKNALIKHHQTFEVHIDEESTKITKKMPIRKNVLSNINKSNWVVPLALFEPSDPKKIPMYHKSKVYAGSEEFSFEEIEAARREKLRKEKEEKLRIQTLEEEIFHLKTQVQMMKNSSSIDKESHHSLIFDETSTEKKQLPDQISQEIQETTNFVKNEIIQQHHAEMVDVYQKLTDEATKDEVSNKYCENESMTQPIKVTDEKKENLLCLVPTVDDKYSLSFQDYDDDNAKLAALSAHSESFNSFNISDSKKLEGSNTEKNLNNNDVISNTYPRFDIQSEDITNLSTSLHTKEVTNMIRGAWYKTLCHSSIEDNTENLVNKINAENQQNGNFVFYQDPSVIISQNAFPANNDVEMIEDLNEEKKENVPPPDYIQEHLERPLSGILQPAMDIPIEEQNQSSDDDEMVCQSKMDELTLYPPNCTEQFEAKVHIASTPFSGIKSNFSAEMNPPATSFISESVNNGQVIQPQSVNAFPNNKPNIENKVFIRNDGELSVIVEKSSEKSSSSSGMEPSANIYSYNSSHHLSSIPKNFSKSMSNELSTTTNKSKSEIKPVEKQYDENVVDIDPFDKEVTDELLSRLANPVCKRPGYLKINKNMPAFKIGNKFTYGSESYIIPEVIAEGAYAKIYLAKKNYENMQISRDCVALKVCKYINEWEFYICTEIHDRLTILNESPNVRNSIMKIEKAIIFNDATILCNQYEKFGSLLDIINLYKQKNQAMPECLVLYITLEMLYIFQQVHHCQIIHADVKPDNFLIVNLKALLTINCFNLEKFNILKLIDFGRSIDMQLYPPGTSFTKVVETSGFKCTEMLEGKPWTYQTDWYGVLGSIHVMLFSEYMKLRKNKNGEWEICNKFKRYWQSDFWQSLFHTFLNIPNCNEIPDITPFINQLNKKLKEPIQINALKTKAKELCNILLL